MPVTAKLSKKVYEKLGEDVTNELVDWFNQVDVTYRADLRELNELNFQRFDAKLEQRLAELDAKWQARFAELDAKWEGRFAALDAKIDRRIAEVRYGMESLEQRILASIAEQRAELIKWNFVFWATALAAILLK